MASREFQCANCGYLFNTEHPYYSEDFARAFEFYNVKVAVSWCLHCNYISEYRPKKLLGLIPTANYVYINSFPIEKLFDKDYYNQRMDEHGGLFGFHIMRMIWHSIDAREKMKNGDAHSFAHTIHSLMNKVPPIYAATAILGVSNTHKSIPLENQIEFGIYQRADDWNFLQKSIDILNENQDWNNCEAVKEILISAQSKM